MMKNAKFHYISPKIGQKVVKTGKRGTNLGKMAKVESYREDAFCRGGKILRRIAHCPCAGTIPYFAVTFL